MVTAFLEAITHVQRLALRTQDRYRAALDRFKDFCRDAGVGSIDHVTERTVEDFVRWLRGQKRVRNGRENGTRKSYKTGGIKFILGTCRTAFNWALRRRMLPPFAYLLARTTEFRNFAIQQMTGSSGRQRVPADSLSKYKVITPEPDDGLFVEFGKLIVPMFQRMSAAMNQSRTLAALRDTLLPKLVSGELRVPDAERSIGRAL